MNRTKISPICSKDECTGCYACYNVCPKKAIYMQKDKFGNVYPVINKDKCINCKLCKKICPQLKEKLDFKIPQAVYAMYSKDDNIRKNSTSGGAATIFYNKVLEDGGVIYGASNLFNDNSFDFIRIDNKEELYKVKGSKYVHCYIKDSYKNAQNDLYNNKKVLFIGTPCQISGLKAFLNKEYDNLLTVDIICHGVPSQQLLFEDIKCNNIDKKTIQYITFRCDDGFKFKIFKSYNDYLKNQPIMSKYCNLDYYYKNFLNGNIYRDNCYSCKYAKKERISDITIGDFWGLDKDSKIYDDELKGISIVMPITQKGYEFVNEIKEECYIEERTLEEACIKNEQLNHPMVKKYGYYRFKELYPKLGYKKTMKKMKTFKDKVKYNKFIYKLYIFLKKEKT